MESGMNQGQVCPFEPKLCQDVATGSRNPLEPLRTPKTHKNQKKINEFSISPPPTLPPWAPYPNWCLYPIYVMTTSVADKRG